MKQQLTLTIAALLAAVPALAAGDLASGAPRLVIAGVIPSTPLIRTLGAPELIATPEAATVLPEAAIPAISVRDAAAIIQAGETGGAAAMEQELARVTASMGAVAESAQMGAGASRGAGAALEASMTGEKLAGASGDVSAPLAVDANADLASKVKQSQSIMHGIIKEISRVIVGQDGMKRGVLFTLIARQHALLEGMPGTAKTRLAEAFADAVEAHNERVQGTPDKLPTDIIGTEALVEDESGKRHFELLQGPIFAELLLVDEINRMPPKTQSALLQAMAEGFVTVGKRKIPLKRFTVIATQNPVEQDGTYRLPEAQLDRFMLKLKIEQPSAEEMERIIDMNRAKDERPKANKVTTLAQLDEIRRVAEKLPLKDDVKKYAIKLAMSAFERMQEDAKNKDKQQQEIAYSIYVRASMDLITAASLHAVFEGRDYIAISDVNEMAVPVLAHRIAMAYGSEHTAEEFVRTTAERLSKTGKK